MNDDTTPPRATRHPQLRRLSAVPSDPPDTRPSAEYRQLDPRDIEIARLGRAVEGLRLELAAHPSQAPPESARTRQGRRVVAVLVPLLTAIVGSAGVQIVVRRPEPAPVVVPAPPKVDPVATLEEARRAAAAAALPGQVAGIEAELRRLEKRLRDLERRRRR